MCHSVTPEFVIASDRKQIMQKSTSVDKTLLLGIFVLSGFSGLIYQSIWSHYLGLFLGHAAYAQALVLSIFMGGMALGAILIARVGERWRNLIRMYALIEGVIGLLGLVFHTTFVATANFSYDTLIPATDSRLLADWMRWLVATLLIVPQTVLLGMTFPLMSGGTIRRFPKEEGRLLGGLYFTNSIGAALGALASTFILLPTLGLPGAIKVAGVLNLIVAALAFMAGRGQEPRPSTASVANAGPSAARVPEPPPAGLLRVVLWSTALSGAASFVYEIVWIRMLGMAVGSTLHAFELMLASFVAGIALGGLWVRKRADQSTDPLRLAGWMQVGMGAAALVSIVVYGSSFEWVGWLMAALDKTDNGYTLYTLGTAVIAILVMLPAAFFAGTTLPLFTVALLRTRHGERAIGQVYAFNTVGSIVGVVTAMHLLIPLMGLKLGLILAALTDMAIGIFLLRRQAQSQPQLRWTAAAGLGTLAISAMALRFHLDPDTLSSGVFRHGKTLVGGELLYYRDGKTSSISLKRFGSQLSIATNGKPDASIQMDDARLPTPDEATMVLAAALPLAMHDRPQQVGIIGFGSGMTTHTFLGDSRVQQADTIEIEQAMVDAARAFGHRVERAYTDLRSHIVIDDAKAFFSGQKKKYDIIISEPSNPWISGVGALFSKEFYEFVPRHLNEDGLFMQWVQLYEIDDQLVSSIFNALTPHFSDYAAYFSNMNDLLIVAKVNGELPKTFNSAIAQGAIAQDLKRQGVLSAAHLKFRHVADAKVIRALGALHDSPPNSYYKPILSLNAPRTRFMKAHPSQTLLLPETDVMWLEALGLRQTLPATMTANSDSHYSGERLVAKARAYADSILQKETTHAVSQDIQEQAILLRSLGQQLCASSTPTPTAHALLAIRLRSMADSTLSWLPAEALVPLFAQPEWLACPVTQLPEPAQKAFALLAAMSQRNWAQARILGEHWLQHSPQEAYWRQAVDDLALSSVMLDFARQGQWQAMLDAEASLGKSVTSAPEYFAARSLLLAMGHTELARITQNAQ